jgi:phenylalanyl-tRNA synthetase beta chain
LQGPVVVRPARAGEEAETARRPQRSRWTRISWWCPTARAAAPRVRWRWAASWAGYDTRVTDATRSVFLEAAHWIPSAIIGRSRKLGLHTDAGHRFERGVDPNLPRIAVERATRLILDVAGGTPGPVIEAVRVRRICRRPRRSRLRRARVSRACSGVDVADAEVERILSRAGPCTWKRRPTVGTVTAPRAASISRSKKT